MTLVFLLEEPSCKYLLDALLPKVIPPEIAFKTIPHSGKQNLQKSIPHKLSGWNIPDSRFVVIQDQDSNDCVKLKDQIRNICHPYGKSVLIRIVCHELESWYFGDLNAVSEAYGKDYTGLGNKRKYRNPDSIIHPKDELRKLIPEYEQIQGARKIGPLMNIDNNTSHSFNVFFDSLKSIVSAYEIESIESE